jgi:hypothetical protein
MFLLLLYIKVLQLLLCVSNKSLWFFYNTLVRTPRTNYNKNRRVLTFLELFAQYIDMVLQFNMYLLVLGTGTGREQKPDCCSKHKTVSMHILFAYKHVTVVTTVNQ